jgi:hypothetical protein
MIFKFKVLLQKGILLIMNIQNYYKLSLSLFKNKNIIIPYYNNTIKIKFKIFDKFNFKPRRLNQKFMNFIFQLRLSI